MVEISMFGSGEGPVWVTGRGYSTTLDLADSAVEVYADWYLRAELSVRTRTKGTGFVI
jgi:hypothetical protein